MTVSLCVIMVEITNNLKLLPLIMLVLLISKVCIFKFPITKKIISKYTKVFPLQAVGDAFNDGIYEEQARLRGIPLLDSKPKYEMRNMIAKEACGSGRVKIILILFVAIAYTLLVVQVICVFLWVFPAIGKERVNAILN